MKGINLLIFSLEERKRGQFSNDVLSQSMLSIVSIWSSYKLF